MKRILTSIWFLAFVIAIPVILIFPSIFDKYRAEILEKNTFRNANFPKLYFEDLDFDGSVERIESFEQINNGKTFSFHFFKENGGMIDQVNFPFLYNPETAVLFFADIDDNKNKEIYTFSVENDSLILHWLEITPKVRNIGALPICKINFYNDSLLDYSFDKIHDVDLDNDGKKELVFSIIGGYSYSPRQIFKVDIAKREITTSKNTGSACGQIHFYDLDGDGKLEIIAEGQVAPVRDWFNLDLNEPAPYLKVFDSDLNYFFPPVKFFNGIQSMTFTNVIKTRSGNELLCTFRSSSADCVPFRAYKINLKGEITDSLVYQSENRQVAKYVLAAGNEHYYTQIEPSLFLEYNSKLELVRKLKLQAQGNLNLIATLNINDDNTDELFFSYPGNKLHVFSNQFRWHKTFQFDKDENLSSVSKLRKGRFYLTSSKGFYLFSFEKNPYYFLRIPVYLIIYFLSLLFVFIFQRIIEGRLKEQYELKNQVRELQLKLFRNQLNPHFIFNTFNGIASVIKKGDTEKAYDVFMRFSKMVRHILDNLDADLIALHSEIELVANFLELQKFRYKSLFEFEIQTEEIDLKAVLVPRLIVQIHVENALKHGILPKGGGGSLKIAVKKRGTCVEISIEDNGIGREKARKLQTGGTGLGIKSMEGIIELINSNSGKKINQKIVDLTNAENQPVGTRVEITLTES